MALSEEDKQWMSATFATKVDLHRIETRLDTEFATKHDLERVETSLLTEFHKWASPAEARQRGQREMLSAIDQELDQLKERVKKLEDRLAS